VPHRARVAAVAVAGNDVVLQLTQWLDGMTAEPPHERLNTRGMVRMAVSVDDLDEALAALAERGLDVLGVQEFALPGTRIGSLRVLFLHDPDGFTVELVHRPPRHFTQRTERRGDAG